MKQLYIIKIGGNVIDNEPKLEKFLADFAKLEGLKILIHGGGKTATDMAEKLGVKQKMIDGRRVTDAKTLEVATMVYGGLINKKIVSRLQALGCNALGLSGADANILPAVRRSAKEVDFGFVGDLDGTLLQTTALKSFLDNCLTPVIAPLTHDGRGQLLNTNADSIASALAIALAKHYEVILNYCFEKKGVLSDVKKESSVIPKISEDEYTELKTKGKVINGMIPKLDTAFSALKKGVSSVVIGHAEDLLFNVLPEAKGTQLYLNR